MRDYSADSMTSNMLARSLCSQKDTLVYVFPTRPHRLFHILNGDLSLSFFEAWCPSTYCTSFVWWSWGRYNRPHVSPSQSVCQRISTLQSPRWSEERSA